MCVHSQQHGERGTGGRRGCAGKHELSQVGVWEHKVQMDPFGVPLGARVPFVALFIFFPPSLVQMKKEDKTRAKRTLLLFFEVY